MYALGSHRADVWATTIADDGQLGPPLLLAAQWAGIRASADLKLRSSWPILVDA